MARKTIGRIMEKHLAIKDGEAEEAPEHVERVNDG